jgi:hypothetical protein
MGGKLFSNVVHLMHAFVPGGEGRVSSILWLVLGIVFGPLATTILQYVAWRVGRGIDEPHCRNAWAGSQACP